MSKIDARVQRSRKKLTDALIDLSLEQGYETLTVAAVAERAQVAHSTIYRHYKSLDDLLIQVLRAMLQDTEKRLARHVNLYDEAVALYTCVKERRKLYRIYADLPPANPARQVISAEFAELMEARCEQPSKISSSSARTTATCSLMFEQPARIRQRTTMFVVAIAGGHLAPNPAG